MSQVRVPGAETDAPQSPKLERETMKKRLLSLRSSFSFSRYNLVFVDSQPLPVFGVSPGVSF